MKFRTFYMFILILESYVKANSDSETIFNATLYGNEISIPLDDTIINIFHVLLYYTK